MSRAKNFGGMIEEERSGNCIPKMDNISVSA
jgi:hypothetical protein